MGVKVMAFTQDDNYPFYVSMIGVSTCSSDYLISRKNSSIYCLEYIMEGSGTVSEFGKSYTAQKGDSYLMHSGSDCLYYTDTANPWRKIWMNFSGDVADKIVSAYKLDDKSYFPQTNIQNYLEEIHHTLSSTENKQEAFDRSACLFMKACQHLYRSVYNSSNANETSIAKKLKNVIDSLSDLTMPFDDIINLIHCSKSHAIREFKAVYHITPYKYILSKKLDLAAELLKNTDITISDLSSQLGFCDSHYFSNFFKRCSGISPLQYRKSTRAHIINEVTERR